MRNVLLLPELAPLALAVLLGGTGYAKLLGRHTARQAAGTALARLLPGQGTAALALRAVGALELVLAGALLAVPLWPVTAAATAALGAGFAGYLAYAKVTAPQSSCGCASARHTPVTWRSFVRAGLVAAGGAGCAAAQAPWWSAAAHRPVAAAGVVIVFGVILVVTSSELDSRWLLPLRRARVRLFGHPLAGTAGEVPVAATVELLENSLAWQTMAPIVRSALADHWDSDGWRILRYSGAYAGADGPRPVSVVFALDANATLHTVSEPVIRVSVVDEESQQAIATPVLEVARRPLLPMAAPGLAGA
jgi:methylamine utilization protein MauE